MKNKKTKINISKTIKAIVLSTSLIIFCMIGYQLSQGTIVHRFFILLGGDLLNGGYIQYLTYLSFFWCIFDIYDKRKYISSEKETLKSNLLPTNETHLLMPSDLINLIRSMRELERFKKSLVIDLIKKACLKFRSTKSSGQMMDMVSIQVEINKEKAESEQSNIRYLTWGIPSLGFIGTVLGISQSLVIANSGDMEQISKMLGVAFDTTLISLILSVIVMWYFYNLQEQTDKLHAEIKEYVMDNLVNRIEF